MNRKERRRAAKAGERGGGTVGGGLGAAPPPAPQGPQHALQQIVAQGVELLRLGRGAEAEACFRRALAIAPEDPDALHFLGLAAHQRGAHGEAARLIERAIAGDGKVAAYHGNLGEVLRALGRPEAATAAYRRALALRPDMADARFGLGTALLEARSYEAAAAELAAALGANPGDADAQLNRGIALFALSRAEEAIAHYRRAIALRPDYGEAHLNLGIALKSQDALREAYRHLARAAELMPGLAEAHYQIGAVLAALERYDEAVQALAEAVRLAPGMVAAQLELGHVLRLHHRNAEAIAAYERAAALDPGSVEPINGIGLARLEEGDFEGARHRFAEALARAPQSADSLFNMGLSYQLQGRFDEAVAWHEKAIAAQPDHAGAHYNLVKSRTSAPGEDRSRELARVLAMPTLSLDQRSALNFALAKVHDDLGEHDAAFAAYRQGNELRKGKLPYSPENFTAYVDRVVAAFDASLFARKAAIGSESELPVFIVGMPRSGTTLVEQILASHPEVHGAGELDYVRQLVHELPQRLGGVPYPACIERLDAATARTLAESHLARLRGHSAAARRITDKMPNNFTRLGVIALLFPRARIVHCQRDPLDTCLSCYFQEFAHGQPFAYDLGHLGRYYRDYERLMAHWRRVLPNPLLEVPYEALVADQEGWSRRMVAHLGLDWDESCLAFHEKERLVRTASFWQVRQPIYASSIGRWRRYARHLGPLFDALGMAPPPA